MLNNSDVWVPLWFGVGGLRAATGFRSLQSDFHMEQGCRPGFGSTALNWNHPWSAKSCSVACGLALQGLFQSSWMLLASLARQERQIRSISWFRRHQNRTWRACREPLLGRVTVLPELHLQGERMSILWECSSWRSMTLLNLSWTHVHC